MPSDKAGIIVTVMNALAHATEHQEAPPVLRDARDEEFLVFLRDTIKGMRRSGRRARPTPREGIEAGLDLMLAAVEERLAA